MPAARFTIKHGPSREELFDALRLQNENREVLFTLIVGRLRVSKRAQIKGIKAQSSDGSQWVIDGSIGEIGTFRGFYNTKDRIGSIA